MALRHVGLVAGLLVLAGCSTVDERNEARARQTLGEMERNFGSCVQQANSNHSHLISSLEGKTALNLANINPVQLSDRSTPSRDQISNLDIIIESHRSCERQFFLNLLSTAPRVAETIRNYGGVRDLIVLDFSALNVSWGDYNYRRVMAWRNFENYYREAVNQTFLPYVLASRESRVRMQEALDGLGQWARDRDEMRLREQQIMNQRLNSMPRIRTSECVRTPYGYSCTSY